MVSIARTLPANETKAVPEQTQGGPPSVAHGRFAVSVDRRELTFRCANGDQRIAARVMTAIIDRSANAGGARSQALGDFDTFRQFVTDTGIHDYIADR